MKGRLSLWVFTIISFVLICAFSSCSENADYSMLSSKEVSLVTWNLQTFFDGKKDGCEYSEFKDNSNWNTEKYKERLERLCQTIMQLNADIYIFQEIEKADVLYDISNFLAGNNWSSKNWKYSCFSKPEDSAIGIGILSKYELTNLSSHGINIKTEYAEQPSCRYILQALVLINDTPLYLFANHWKSKSGGEKESEIWRCWQENLLSQKISKVLEENPDANVLICGDFNKDINDFTLHQNKEKCQILIKGTDYNKLFQLPLYSPWLDSRFSSSNLGGSYYYKDKWEKIDHFFSCGKIQVTFFQVCNYGPWVNSDLTPYKYNIFTGQGYSDHLPLLCKVKLNKNDL